MTRDEILSMAAGRGMDALVATYIFHMVWWKRGGGAYIALPPEDREIPDYWEQVDPPRGLTEDTLSESVPRWSQHWSAVRDVIEQLQELDFWFSISYKTAIYPDDLSRPGWGARFRCVRGGTRGDHFAPAETFPLAICRAALLAVEPLP